MDCQKINDYAIRLSSVDDKWLEFGNHCNKQRVPFIVYALECVLRKIKPDRKDASSYQQHEVFSIGALLIWRVIVISVSSRYRLYSVVRATTQRFDIEWRIWYPLPMETLSNNRRRTVTRRDATFVRNRLRSDNTRIRYHCHLTVDTIHGPAHANCKS